MRSLVVVSFAFVAACAADPTAVPPRLPDRPASILLPPGAYASYTIPFPGVRSGFLDVNDKLQMVGYVGDDAILAELGGSIYKLDKAGARQAQARAVNNVGSAAGWVLNPVFESPAIWDSPQAPVLVRPEQGWVADMNDRQEAVGAVSQPGYYRAYYWEAQTGLFTLLPLPPGTTWSNATGINNDRVVVGQSSVGGLMWERRSRRGWSVTVLNGMEPWAVDAGYGTVGTYNYEPAWGNPYFAATLGAGGVIYGIHHDGTMSGGVSSAPFGVMTAFVADRSGAGTRLPTPRGYGSTEARNSASCGLVVGQTMDRAVHGGFEAIYWDPGC